MKKFLLVTTVLASICGTAASAQATQAGQATPPATTSAGQGNAPAADAQPAADGGIADIIVTAQQRSESLQRAAISVTAINSQTLVNSGVTDISRITNITPAFRATVSNGPYDKLSLRGISNFTSNAQQDNGIIINANGVPLARPTGAHGIFFDLERVEVLKGPQGILYGRNATGGVINLVVRKPGNELAANVGLDVGSYNLVNVNGGIDLPLSDQLTTRTAFQIVRHDGYYKDGTGDEDGVAGRFTLAYAPSSDFHLSLVGDYSRDRGNGPGASLIYGSLSGKSGFVDGAWSGLNSSDAIVQAQFAAIGATARRKDNTFQDNKYWGVTGTAVWNTGIGDLTTIAAHRVVNQNYENTVPTFYQGEVTRSNQDSLEVRLASSGSGPLKWIIGGFYLDEKAHVQQLNEQGTSLSNSDINLHSATVAGFGQLTYAVSSAFRIVGGLRYNHDYKMSYSPRYTIANYPFATASLRDRPAINAGTFAAIVDQSHAWNSLTYKGGVEFDAGPDSLLYANVSSGFKAGGFSYGPPGGVVYNPEHVTQFLVGSKNRFFDRSLQINVEAFYLKYKDQQLQRFALVPGIGNFTLTENIGKSHIYGVEWEIVYLPVQNTRLNFSGQYLKGKYDQFTYISPTSQSGTQTCPQTVVATGFQVDCSGRTLINAPEWVVQGGIDQTVPLNSGANVVLSLSSRYESSRETQINYFTDTKVAGFVRSDASIAYNSPNHKWSLTAYVRNLENKIAYGVVLPGRSYSTVTGGILAVSLEPPRTYGVRLAAKF